MCTRTLDVGESVGWSRERQGDAGGRRHQEPAASFVVVVVCVVPLEGLDSEHVAGAGRNGGGRGCGGGVFDAGQEPDRGRVGVHVAVPARRGEGGDSGEEQGAPGRTLAGLTTTTLNHSTLLTPIAACTLSLFSTFVAFFFPLFIRGNPYYPIRLCLFFFFSSKATNTLRLSPPTLETDAHPYLLASKNVYAFSDCLRRLWRRGCACGGGAGCSS